MANNDLLGTSLPRRRRGLTFGGKAGKNTMTKPLFQNIDCLIFKVPDIDAALTFYRDKLGLPLAWRTETGLALRVGESELVLSTEHQRPPETDIKVSSAGEAAKRFKGLLKTDKDGFVIG